jgi:hypothetical protein
LIEEKLSVDKCDCPPDHPTHRHQQTCQGLGAPGARRRLAVDEAAQLMAGPVAPHKDEAVGDTRQAFP